MKQSAGLLIYKIEDGQVKVLLGHIGGPFYMKKDEAAWDIPKGEYQEEDALAAAYREFKEEIGQEPPSGEPKPLGEFTASGKVVKIWALEGDLDASSIKSNIFKQEWPPKSGKIQEFPEVDEAAWFDLDTAMGKIVKARQEFLRRLAEYLKVPAPQTGETPQQSLF